MYLCSRRRCDWKQKHSLVCLALCAYRETMALVVASYSLTLRSRSEVSFSSSTNTDCTKTRRHNTFDNIFSNSRISSSSSSPFSSSPRTSIPLLPATNPQKKNTTTRQHQPCASPPCSPSPSSPSYQPRRFQPRRKTLLWEHATPPPQPFSFSRETSSAMVLKRNWLDKFVYWWDCHIVYGNFKSACS